MSEQTIQFHEDEYLKSYVSDEILLAVLAISGLKEKDKLLYKDDAKCSISSNSYTSSVTSR